MNLVTKVFQISKAEVKCSGERKRSVRAFQQRKSQSVPARFSQMFAHFEGKCSEQLRHENHRTMITLDLEGIKPKPQIKRDSWN